MYIFALHRKRRLAINFLIMLNVVPIVKVKYNSLLRVLIV